MIAVAGESLIDLITDAPDRLTAVPGGAPFNVARVLASLGVRCTFVSRLSSDRFGARLRAELLEAGVVLAVTEAVQAPTTLAVAQVDAGGSADYSFYGECTASACLRLEDIPRRLLDGHRALTLGGLGIVLDPMRTTLLGMALEAPRDVLVVLDPNCRPSSVGDRPAYLETVSTLLARTDVLKLSRQDVAFLDPGCDPMSFARDALELGPSVVIVTDGAEPTLLLSAEGMRVIPVPSVDVVDTIGAGDAFLAGLLAWLENNPEIDPRCAGLDTLCAGCETAAAVAGAVCTMRGAVLPDGFTCEPV